MVLPQPVVLDVVHHGDRVQDVLVHGVDVAHGELHLGGDAAELGDEAAEHARIVHQPQRPIGRAPPRQHVEEGVHGLRIPPEPGRDQVQVAGDRGEGVRMQVEVLAVGEAEQPDQGGGVAFEQVRPLQQQPAALLHEARLVELPRRAAGQEEQARQALRGLGPVSLQLGAEDPRQGADLFDGHEVAAHEPLHRRLAVAGPEPHAGRDLGLKVEHQPVLGAAAGEVQVHAHRPKEVERPLQRAAVPRREGLDVDDFGGLVLGIEVLGDPEQGVQVA